MLGFEKYTPYKLNFELINGTELEILDESYKIIGKKTFREIVGDIFQDDISYTYEKESFNSQLVIAQGERKIFIKLHDYVTDILAIILEICKDREVINSFHNLLWLYIDRDHVLNDTQEFYHFFICDGKKVLKERVSLSDDPLSRLPENLLQLNNDYFFSSDSSYEMAMVRRCYEKFYKETDYGQLVAFKEKNDFEMGYFNRLFPDIDNVNISQLFLFKLNQLQKQLRLIVWLIVSILILVLLILIK